MEVASETSLVLDSGIMAVGDTYEVYNGNQDNSTGLLLYIELIPQSVFSTAVCILSK